MKPIRWTPHALQNLVDREIERAEADRTLAQPEFIVPGQPPRLVYMRRYLDSLLQQERTRPMKVSYDKETDSLTITLRDERIKESDEIRPGVIADFGYDGGVVRFEILQASKVVGNIREMQFVISE